ncbi:hypothetical protein [Paracidovorax wautersii]|uniref:Uncharacterized protein n=1 Tax=Paracidovorax wautersii TaxID=1177982 RepID=A0A1I2I0G1_9BURK|nr:hypothetical protein [Paracidovorax wautersii]SFF35123.1 hypothetical protein SAMN04489711_1511 [Paracidovorax wautersii]
MSSSVAHLPAPAALPPMSALDLQLALFVLLDLDRRTHGFFTSIQNAVQLVPSPRPTSTSSTRSCAGSSPTWHLAINPTAALPRTVIDAIDEACDIAHQQFILGIWRFNAHAWQSWQVATPYHHEGQTPYCFNALTKART